MLPVFNEYRGMLKEFGVDLSNYDEDKLWIDRMIIRGFDKNGNDKKICRLKVTDELTYEYKFYDKLPKNDELETWKDSYNRLYDVIAERERESLDVIKMAIEKYPEHKYILATSMGKDSKLLEYLLDLANVNCEKIFNNTTCDSADVYKEVKARKDIKIVTPKDKNGNNLSLYRLMNQWGVASRHSRWCCSTFKEGATNSEYKCETNVLYFMGMRNVESNTRSKYQDEEINPNWNDKTWTSFLPIRRWSDVELWLYTIINEIPINEKYKKGYHRVGCHIVCPFYNKSTWVLDKYWYRNQYDRFHKILHDDFLNNEKTTRMNCTLDEWHMNWNGGIVREEPTDEVLQEFMKYKGITDKNVAMKYFNKSCKCCGKRVYKKDEVAMNLKYFGRNINTFMCKKCFLKEMGMAKEDWDRKVSDFKRQDCKLF